MALLESKQSVDVKSRIEQALSRVEIPRSCVLYENTGYAYVAKRFNDKIGSCQPPKRLMDPLVRRFGPCKTQLVTSNYCLVPKAGRLSHSLQMVEIDMVTNDSD